MDINDSSLKFNVALQEVFFVLAQTIERKTFIVYF